MNTRSLEFVVGLFVLSGLVLLAVLMVFFGSAVTFGRSHYDVAAVFTNVRGMAPGTPVRYLGIDIGELRATRFTESRDKVKLILRIYREHKIPANAKLTMRPEGLLGDYYLEFYGGNLENGTLPVDGSAVIVGQTAVSFDEIASKIGDFTTKLDGVLDNLQNNLTSFVTRINKFLDNETMQNNLSAILDGLGHTLGDKKFQDDLKSFAAGLNRTVGDEKFQADLRAAAAEAPETVRSFREMGKRVTDLAQRADELVVKLKALSDKMDTQVTHQGENMDQLAASLRKNLDAVNETLGNINEILARINEGKGTVGKLMTNDELHTKLIKAIDELNEALVEVGKMADGIRKRWGQ